MRTPLLIALALLTAPMPAQWTLPTLTPTPASADALWTTATPVSVGDEAPITLQALSDGEILRIKIQWPDPEPDMSREPWEFRDGRWEITSIQDDQLTIELSDIRVPPGTFTDVWQWGARLTNPSETLIDRFKVSDVLQPNGYDRVDSGVPNSRSNEQHGQPSHVWRRGRPRPLADPDAMPPLMARRTEWMGARHPFTGNAWSEGDRLPRFIHIVPEGSAADVSGQAEWSDGHWTLEIERALITGDTTGDLPLTEGERLLIEITVRNGATGAETTHRLIGLF